MIGRRADSSRRRPRRRDLVAFAAALVLGAVMIYCFWLVLSTVRFWVVRMDHVQRALGRHLPDGSLAGRDLPWVAALQHHLPRSDRVRCHGSGPGRYRSRSTGRRSCWRPSSRSPLRLHALVLALRPAQLHGRLGVGHEPLASRSDLARLPRRGVVRHGDRLDARAGLLRAGGRHGSAPARPHRDVHGDRLLPVRGADRCRCGLLQPPDVGDRRAGDHGDLVRRHRPRDERAA